MRSATSTRSATAPPDPLAAARRQSLSSRAASSRCAAQSVFTLALPPAAQSLRLVSCPTNNLLDPPADFRAGQGAPTRHSAYYGEEAQRRPARKDAAQRVSYLWDRTLGF